ncbi:MAG: hypothetical protein ACLFUU_13895 [Desulfobacteraceae bacterium]
MTEEKPQNPQEVIVKMLASGQVAKLKLYNDLLARIKQGERLEASELSLLRDLEKELEAQAGQEKLPDFIPNFDSAAAYCGFSQRTLSYHIKRGNIKQRP